MRGRILPGLSESPEISVTRSLSLAPDGQVFSLSFLAAKAKKETRSILKSVHEIKELFSAQMSRSLQYAGENPGTPSRCGGLAQSPPASWS